MTVASDLAHLVSEYYNAAVLLRGSIPHVVEQFQRAAKDETFLNYARQHLASLEGVPDQQCFVSAKAKEFLRNAIAQVEAAHVQAG